MLELLKSAAEVATPIAAILTAIITVVFAALRKKDTQHKADLMSEITLIKDRLTTMDAIERYLQTIADQYCENITKGQALTIIELTYLTVRLNISSWVVRYVTEGCPNFGRGRWDIDKIVNGEFHVTTCRLQAFKYKDAPLSVYLRKGEFDYILEELRKDLNTYNKPVDAAEFVTREVNTMLWRTVERVNQEADKND